MLIRREIDGRPSVARAAQHAGQMGELLTTAEDNFIGAAKANHCRLSSPASVPPTGRGQLALLHDRFGLLRSYRTHAAACLLALARLRSGRPSPIKRDDCLLISAQLGSSRGQALTVSNCDRDQLCLRGSRRLNCVAAGDWLIARPERHLTEVSRTRQQECARDGLLNLAQNQLETK